MSPFLRLQFGTSIRVDVYTHGTIRTTGQKFQDGATTATHIEQVANWRGHGEIENGAMQRTKFCFVLIPERFVADSIAATSLQQVPVRFEDRVLVGNQFQKLLQILVRVPVALHTVENPFPITEPRQKPSLTQRFQLLRNPGLTLPNHPG
ncbi:MAG: hypothetical protein ACE5F8_09545, partial [Woeseiaceae bacterium]